MINQSQVICTVVYRQSGLYSYGGGSVRVEGIEAGIYIIPAIPSNSSRERLVAFYAYRRGLCP